MGIEKPSKGGWVSYIKPSDKMVVNTKVISDILSVIPTIYID